MRKAGSMAAAAPDTWDKIKKIQAPKQALTWVSHRSLALRTLLVWVSDLGRILDVMFAVDRVWVCDVILRRFIVAAARER